VLCGMRNLVYFNVPEQFFVIGTWAALTTLAVRENFFQGSPRNHSYRFLLNISTSKFVKIFLNIRIIKSQSSD